MSNETESHEFIGWYEGYHQRDAEIERLWREVERMRLTLHDIRDGYGPQHESRWCRDKAAIGLLTSMKPRTDEQTASKEGK